MDDQGRRLIMLLFRQCFCAFMAWKKGTAECQLQILLGFFTICIRDSISPDSAAS
jgi:hypothetical protein